MPIVTACLVSARPVNLRQHVLIVIERSAVAGKQSIRKRADSDSIDN